MSLHMGICSSLTPPCAPNPGDSWMWLSPALTLRSQIWREQVCSGPHTALTYSEFTCLWPNGFQMLWPQN